MARQSEVKVIVIIRIRNMSYPPLSFAAHPSPPILEPVVQSTSLNDRPESTMLQLRLNGWTGYQPYYLNKEIYCSLIGSLNVV